MTRKIVIGALVAILVGAVAVGAVDYLRKESALAYQDTSNNVAVNGQPAAKDQGHGNRGRAQGSADASGRSTGRANERSDVAQPLARVDEWINVSGVVGSVDNNALTVETAAGERLVVELGPPHFWSSQEVILEPGDSVEVLGFYEGDSFIAGEIRLVDSGEHIMLRDPNGRPLWAGGSATGQGRGNETAGCDSATGQGRGNETTGRDSATGQGRGNETAGCDSVKGRDAGNSHGLADGGQIPQPKAVVDEWITVQGTVSAVELNALTIETADGETMLVQLGPEHFWTAQGITFEAGDQVKVTGFYEDGASFNAGEVMLLDTGETLMLREASGRPLWAGGRGNGRQGSH